MARAWFLPSTEPLLAKRAALGARLEEFAADALPDPQRRILDRCAEGLAAVDGLQRPWHQHHPNLAWRHLHRVDEDLLLVLPHAELRAEAEALRTDFDRNVVDERLRKTWLGTDGKSGLLGEAAQAFQPGAAGQAPPRDGAELEARYLLRKARHLLDAQADRDFWSLSVSTVIIVLSGVALGAAMLAYGLLGYGRAIQEMAEAAVKAAIQQLGAGPVHVLAIEPLDRPTLVALVLLGLMGGYLSNMVTKKNFLFPPGGPYWRFAVLHLVARPIMSAFGAVLVIVLVKSGFLLAINQAGQGGPGVVALQVPRLALGYAYATLAIASGFGADKVLRSMIGRVLRLLEQRAEKTKPSPEPRPPPPPDEAQQGGVPTAG